MKSRLTAIVLTVLAFMVVSIPVVAEEPIKIANIEALSGAFEQFGNQSKVGFQLGMEYYTKGSMKLLDRPVEIIIGLFEKDE